MNVLRRLLLLFVLVFVAAHSALANGDELPAEGKLVAGKTYGALKLEELNDLNDVLLTDGKQRIHIVLANVLPFADWPKATASQNMKINFLEQLKAGLIDKEVGLSVLEIDEQGIAQCDLILGPGYGLGKEFWDIHPPSGRDGWGMTNFNLLLIERGYSPYVRSVYVTPRHQRTAAEFDEAALLARHDRVGIFAASMSDSSSPATNWNVGELTALASKRSNECQLILRGLEWPQQKLAAEQLLKLPDAKIRYSVVSAMQQFTFSQRQLTQQQLNEWGDVLMGLYFDEPELSVRKSMLGTMKYLRLPADIAQPFLQKVLETETDEGLLKFANYWQKDLK
jgi:hypothetical protein